MKIITLVENTVENEKCIAEHGLSIYIETEKHILLLDTGQTDAVVKNAEVLNIDLSAVDTVILSHGHYDHSGYPALRKNFCKFKNCDKSVML